MKLLDGVCIPQIMDVIDYTDNRGTWLAARVTMTETRSGYTEVWLNAENHRGEALFNVNHTTGFPNTHYSRNGQWQVSVKPPGLALRNFVSPYCPVNLKRVESIHDPSITYTRTGAGGKWVRDHGSPVSWTWSQLLQNHPDGVREVESEYDASLRRLKDGVIPDRISSVTWQQYRDMRAVVMHALSSS